MKTKPRITLLEITVIAVIAFSVTILFLPQRKNSLPEPERFAVLGTNTIPSKYSPKEMEDFFAAHLQPLLGEALPKGHFRIPEIQERYNVLRNKTFERYGKDINWKLITGYLPESKMVLAGCSLQGGVPTIEFLVPSIMEVYEMRRREGASDTEFEFIMLVGVMHELDHLAYGYVSESDRDKLPPLEKLVEHEKQTWALTCEHTIRPLIEKYTMSLSPSEWLYYSAWLTANRDVNDPKWEAFIRSQYKQTR